MTVEEMKESIIKLAEHLLKVGERLNNHLLSSDKTSMSACGMVWMLMIGACYSLLKALPLLDKSRNPQDQINAAKKLLSQIIKEEELISINKEDCGSWVVGYYLYSAEQRISSALDRIVKTHLDQLERDRSTSTYKNIQKILKQCPICNEPTKKECLPRSEMILRKLNWKKYSDLCDKPDEFYADKSEGGCLNRVCFRVNDIKHYPHEMPNPEEAILRWRDAHSALNGLIQIFEDFAAHRGYYA